MNESDNSAANRETHRDKLPEASESRDTAADERIAQIGEAVVSSEFEKVESQAKTEQDLQVESYLSQFSAAERAIISRLPRAYGQIAYDLQISESTIRSHIHSCLGRRGLPNINAFTAELVFAGGLSTEDMAEGLTYKLSEIEAEILKYHYFRTYKETARLIGVSVSTMRTRWHSIFEKMGMPPCRRHLVMMAIKDGLITSPELADDDTAAV
jgi:DNA-binding NarL/FixJ family response regulator